MPKVIDKATIKTVARISLGRHRNAPPPPTAELPMRGRPWAGNCSGYAARSCVRVNRS